MNSKLAWDRPLIGNQPFKGQTWCYGTNEATLLAEIVGWAVGCENEERNRDAINDLRQRGLITTRRHVAPVGEWDSYALTAAGFERLAEIGYGEMHDRAVRTHKWYAENAAQVRVDAYRNRYKGISAHWTAD